MRYTLLLIIIYLAFISLGLPDSLLGTAWPTMFEGLSVPVHYAGIVSMIVAAGTVVSSLCSSIFIKRFGVAAITTFSVLLTALALLGFSYAHHFIFLCLLAIPLGLGAGCVDTALNNYVALHYEAKHMNWLHCFWGVGAAIGPMIMSGYLAAGKPWSLGYKSVALIQVALVVILFFSFPLWIKAKKEQETNTEAKTSFKTLAAFPGLKQALMVFFCYCTIEATFGLWGASYLVFVRNITPEKAAQIVSFFYIGITLGRFFSGFITARLNSWQMIYGGQLLVLLALIVLILPFQFTLLPAFFLVGFGCAPIFPCLLHETPRNFGEKHSQTIMGLQMASAYVGITFMPLLFGQLTRFLGYSFFLWFAGIMLVLKFYFTYSLNTAVRKRNHSATNQ